MVGLGGLEPPTSRLSGVRSNHLSYRPMPGVSNLKSWKGNADAGPAKLFVIVTNDRSLCDLCLNEDPDCSRSSLERR